MALLAARRELVRPAMAAFWDWHGEEAGLELCLSDPDVRLDTNGIERQNRTIATGRKNWLFSWSEAGAQDIADIQSLLLTCRLQGVDPWIWLVDVLQRMSVHPASRVDELTPRLWKGLLSVAPMGSDIASLTGRSASPVNPVPARSTGPPG